MRRLVYLLLMALPIGAVAAQSLRITRPFEYSGLCDASAAVALSSNLFVVATDENNRLRVYRSDRPGPPVQEVDLDGFLGVTDKSPEADLEGAARIGDRAFWITSHGRNRNAKERLNRCRFFATEIRVRDGQVSITPAGKPYRTLLDDLSSDARFMRFDFNRAADRAPKDSNALNIEGLAATVEGHLLLGFRNPIPDGKALVIPLLNPNGVIEGERAQLGAAMQLDLGGLGIRDMALYQNSYLIMAGSFSGGGKFRLYRWNGSNSAPERLEVDHLNRYNPEALIIYPDRGLREFQVLSDDGERLIDGIPGKQIKEPARQKFRSFWLVQELNR